MQVKPPSSLKPVASQPLGLLARTLQLAPAAAATYTSLLLLRLTISLGWSSCARCSLLFALILC